MVKLLFLYITYYSLIKRTVKSVCSLVSLARIVPVRSSRFGDEAICELLKRFDRTLSNVRCSVHVVVAALIQTVPVYWYSFRIQRVRHLNDHLSIRQLYTSYGLSAGYCENGWLSRVVCFSSESFVCMSVCPQLTSGFKTKKASVMIFSPSESLNISPMAYHVNGDLNLIHQKLQKS